MQYIGTTPDIKWEQHTTLSEQNTTLSEQNNTLSEQNTTLRRLCFFFRSEFFFSGQHESWYINFFSRI